MSKKKTGLLIILSAAIGAAVGGISYYLKYKSFNDELDKDFHDYEEEAGGEGGVVPCEEAANRTYITLDPEKGKAHEGESSAAKTETPPKAADVPENNALHTPPKAADALQAEASHTPAEQTGVPQAETLHAPAEQTGSSEDNAPSAPAAQPSPAVTVEEDTDGVDA